MPADWYAVGVMIYQALTDRLPCVANPRDILFAKPGTRVPRPSVLALAVPPDLDALCMDLLNPDPERRPRAEEVVRRLTRGEGSGERTVPAAAVSHGSLRPFVGRQQQLDQLDQAFAASARGEPVVVLLTGSSGMGKTVLAQRFFEPCPRAARSARAVRALLRARGPCRSRAWMACSTS